MSRKNSNLVVTVVSVILVLGILCGVIAIIYRFTDGFQEDLKTFYLEYNGKSIMNSSGEMKFSSGSEVRFDVKYPFDLSTEERDYNVRIIPNESESFDYSVGEGRYYWSAVDTTADLSSAFELKKEGTYFTFSLPHRMTVLSVLEKIYPGQAIVVPDAEILSLKLLYALEVSSYNQSVTYTILFSVLPETIGSVEVDASGHVFGGGVK